MKKLAIVFLVISLVACKNTSEKKSTSENPSKEKKEKEEKVKTIPTLAYNPELNAVVKDTIDDNLMLLGIINQQGFKTKQFSEWFTENYNDHTLDLETIKTIGPKLKNINIKVFMGTWCSDSQRETPALYKVLEAAKFNMENLEVVAVNHDKETPKHLEEGMDIQYVPTIIFYKNGKEIGRYVESAQETLEKDMLAILNETGYKHIYEE